MGLRSWAHLGGYLSADMFRLLRRKLQALSLFGCSGIVWVLLSTEWDGRRDGRAHDFFPDIRCPLGFFWLPGVFFTVPVLCLRNLFTTTFL